MAASLGEGQVATLGYANRIVSVVLVVIATGVGTVLLPTFSSAAQSAQGELRSVFRRSSVLASGMACLVAVGLVAVADPLVTFLLQGGELTEDDTEAIVEVLRLYALQLPFYVFGVIGARLLNALGRNTWLLLMGLVNLALNIALNLVLMPHFGVRGIAFGTSTVYAFSSIVMLVAARTLLRVHERTPSGASS